MTLLIILVSKGVDLAVVMEWWNVSFNWLNNNTKLQFYMCVRAYDCTRLYFEVFPRTFAFHLSTYWLVSFELMLFNIPHDRVMVFPKQRERTMQIFEVVFRWVEASITRENSFPRRIIIRIICIYVMYHSSIWSLISDGFWQVLKNANRCHVFLLFLGALLFSFFFVSCLKLTMFGICRIWIDQPPWDRRFNDGNYICIQIIKSCVKRHAGLFWRGESLHNHHSRRFLLVVICGMQPTYSHSMQSSDSAGIFWMQQW